MMRSRGIILFVIAIVAAREPGALAQRASSARAQRKQPNQKELDEARAHFKAAEAAKARGEYRTAAVEYLAAYQLFEEPEFFFDTAEVYRLAGDEQNALTYYEKYLEIDPSGRGAATARSNADQLRRLIAAKQDAASRAKDEEARRKVGEQTRSKAGEDARRKADEEAGPNGEEATRKAGEESRRKVEENTRRRVGAARRGAGSPAQSVPSTTATPAGRSLRIAGIATGAAGVVALGVAASFGFKARNLSNELSSADAFDRARYDQGKAADRNLLMFSGVGAAGVVAGGLLYYFGHRDERAAGTDTGLTLAPVIAPSRLTATVVGRF